MAPLDFDNSLNVASLAGTWMGTIFTGVGLLAVLTQLRTLLLYVNTENRHWKERAAGAWANCILADHLPSNGIQEDTVPIFSGWLQNFYVQEKTVTVSQDDRGVSGKSSWSNLFARLDIKAADLITYGGSKFLPAPIRRYDIEDRKIRALRPGLGDALIENGSISYGFSAAEFAALIILCGFRPGDFALNRARHSTSNFGQINVADHGQFSQIAKFDSHHGFRDSIGSFKSDMCDIPIAQSLNLAFGMIRAKGRRGRAWVIPCQPDAHSKLWSNDLWGKYALPQQLQKIQYCFERFVGSSELVIANYAEQNDAFEADDALVLEGLMSASGVVLSRPISDDNFRARAREVLNASHAIAGIRPWALLPVLPVHLVAAVKYILNPFYKTRAFTVGILQRQLGMIPGKTFRPEGRTGEELSQRLSLFVFDKDSYFGSGAHSSVTSTYHEAMSLVFYHRDISFDDVRISLAAAVGTKLFWLPEGNQEGAENFEPFQESLRQYLQRCYLAAGPAEKSRDVPGWAIDVYANYLRGWITDSIPADPDLISYFRRRVFLA